MTSNPYTLFISSANGVPFGRDSLLEELARIITLQPRPEHRDIHALPGTGKSTLLRHMADPAFAERARKWFTGDFHAHPERLLFIYVSGWVQSIHPFFLILRQFYAAVAERESRLDLPPLPRLEPSSDVSDADQALNHMEQDVWRLHEAGVRPVFLLDDFHQPEAFGSLSKQQSGTLGSWKDVCAFILGTERRLQDVNPDAKGSPLFKQLPQTPFGDLPEEEALEFVRSPLPKNCRFPEADIHCLYELAGGFPYLLLLAGQALWDLRRQTGLLEAGDRPLSLQLRALLEGRLAQDFDRTFHLFYEALNSEQRDGLYLLATSPSMQMGDGLDRRSNRLSWLPQYGLVHLGPEGDMHLFSPLFAEYILDQRRPAEALQPTLSGLQQELYNFLRQHPGQLLTYEDLWRSVGNWSSQGRRLAEEDKARIHLAISKLRQQLPAGEQIASVRSRGYRYEPATAARSIVPA